MKIFITGTAGLIGSWICSELLKDGHKVVSVDNMSGGYYDNIPQHPNHSFYKADICDLYRMINLMEGCEIIIHCACMSHEGLSIFCPTRSVNSIVGGTTSIATAGINNKVKRFINFSSMAMFGNNEIPYTENMPLLGAEPYGIAKSGAVNLLNNLADIHKFETVHLVPHNVFGKNNLYQDPFRSVLSIFCNLMLQGKQPIIYGDGEQQRSMTFIQDEVKIIKRFIDCDIENKEIFNIGPDSEDRRLTINQLAKKVADCIGFKLNPVYMPDRPFEIKKAYCSSEKIRKKFGQQPQVSLDDGIKSIVDYIKNRGVRPFEYHIDLEINNDLTPTTWKEKLF